MDQLLGVAVDFYATSDLDGHLPRSPGVNSVLVFSTCEQPNPGRFRLAVLVLLREQSQIAQLFIVQAGGCCHPILNSPFKTEQT